MDALALLTEQVWSPALDRSDALRVQAGGSHPAGWTTAESYWLFPSASRAQMALPAVSSTVAAAASTSYAGLRRPVKNLARGVLGAATRAGLPAGADRCAVLVRDDTPEAAALLPVSAAADAVGVPRLHASMGVRTGANRKATMHLYDDDARPVAFAKLGWSATTDGFVTTEHEALREVGGGTGLVRAPAPVACLDHLGHRLLLTEPLPLDVRGARSARTAPPSPQEMFALTPIHRRAPLGETEHVRRLDRRLGDLAPTAESRGLAQRAGALLRSLARSEEPMPVTTRWHGDLTPWNRARDGNGTLWVWDWESSEPDAAAGLDPLHWAFSERRPPSGAVGRIDLAACVRDASVHLRAAGLAGSRWGDLAALYAVTVVERAVDLAHRAGGWERLWIQPHHLGLLLEQAAYGADRPAARAG